MTFSPERIAAYQQLEDAINNLRAVTKKERDIEEDSVVETWILLTSEVSMYAEDDPDKPEDDEEMKNSVGCWSKRGSMAVVNHALCQSYLDECLIEAFKASGI